MLAMTLVVLSCSRAILSHAERASYLGTLTLAHDASQAAYPAGRLPLTEVPDALLVSPLQDGAAGTLRAFPVVQIAHFDLAYRYDLERGSSAGVDAIPQRVTGLRANELLFELAAAPGAHGKAVLLSVDIDLQRHRDKLRRLLKFGGLAAQIAKCAGPNRYLDLNPVEWPNPFTCEVGLGRNSSSCHRQKKNPQCRRMAFYQVGLPSCRCTIPSELAVLAPGRSGQPFRHRDGGDGARVVAMLERSLFLSECRA
jgi:hypothetical protein